MISNLQSASQLVSKLQYSALSVVLFTALWSGENQLVLNNIKQAQKLVQCNLSINYYQLPAQLHQLSPLPQPPVQHSTLFWTKKKAHTILHDSKFPFAVRNVTANIPWFPCIRYFKNDSYSVKPITHTDSFDVVGIANQITNICNELKKDHSDQRQSQSPLTIQQKEENSFISITKHTTPLSRDSFASYLYQRQPYTGRGLLLFVGSTFSKLQNSHLTIWSTVSQGIAKLNNRVVDYALPTTYREWFASIVDINQDVELAKRNGISKNSNKTQMLLIDPQHDSFQLHALSSEIGIDKIMNTLVQFETNTEKRSVVQNRKISRKQHDSTINSENKPQTLKTIFSYFDITSPIDKYFAPTQCFISLSDVNHSRYDRPSVCKTEVWLFVMHHSCGFSQRILPDFNRVRESAHKLGKDVHVFSVFDLSMLPPALDAMVGGFPTVLRLRKFMKWQEISEYVGLIDIPTLRRVLDENTTRASVVLHPSQETMCTSRGA